MSQSKKLSENTNQHVAKNVESHEQDLKIKSVSVSVLQTLKTKYPQYEFGIDTKFFLRDIALMYNDEPEIGKKANMKPDGGFIWFKTKKSKKYYILISEQKRQGTNDKLNAKGSKKQSYGNATDRLGRPCIQLEMMFGNEKILPYIVFLQGCDFHEGETTIFDRTKATFKFLKPNVINLYKIQLAEQVWAGGSYFVRGHSYKEAPGSSDWTFEEIYVQMLDLAEQSIKYYLEKYGE